MFGRVGAAFLARSAQGARSAAPSSSSRLGAAQWCAQRFSSTSGEKASAPKQPTIDELARSIDTTLTAEQRVHVDMLRRKIKGGANAPRSLYRDVPRPDEVTGVGNFLPKIADNAEELIDFALSHVPLQAGPRRSRFKQRLINKAMAKKKQDDLRKEQTLAARLLKDVKLKKQRALVQQYLAEAKVINEARAKRASSGSGSSVSAATSS